MIKKRNKRRNLATCRRRVQEAGKEIDAKISKHILSLEQMYNDLGYYAGAGKEKIEWVEKTTMHKAKSMCQLAYERMKREQSFRIINTKIRPTKLN